MMKDVREAGKSYLRAKRRRYSFKHQNPLSPCRRLLLLYINIYSSTPYIPFHGFFSIWPAPLKNYASIFSSPTARCAGGIDDWSLSSEGIMKGSSNCNSLSGTMLNPVDKAPVDPLQILTGEGRPPVAGWLSAVGDSNLVASGMERVGELDPGEVRCRNHAMFSTH